MVLVDGHVHIYGCFDAGAAFDAAAKNFASAAQAHAGASDYDAVLCLVEGERERFFDGVRGGREGRVWRGRHGYWEVEPTAEPETLEVRCGAKRMHLVAGRQIVTRERLEVLALATTAAFRDGESLETTLGIVLAAGAAAVLPWGVGKWLGARGAAVGRVLADPRWNDVFLGDNGNRLHVGPEPVQLAAARRAGRRVLPGSDPLPLPGEEARVASYGFALDAPLDPLRPAAALLASLRSGARVSTFGHRTPITRFVGSQLALKWQSRAARVA